MAFDPGWRKLAPSLTDHIVIVSFRGNIHLTVSSFTVPGMYILGESYLEKCSWHLFLKASTTKTFFYYLLSSLVIANLDFQVVVKSSLEGINQLEKAQQLKLSLLCPRISSSDCRGRAKLLKWERPISWPRCGLVFVVVCSSQPTCIPLSMEI